MSGTPSSGIFSLAIGDGDRGIAIGGDYKEPGRANRVVALTSDGGRTWRSPKGPGPGGYRSAVAYRPAARGATLVAVGPTGSDWSRDEGESWTRLGEMGFHAVGFAGAAGWAVGEDGRIAGFDTGRIEARRMSNLPIDTFSEGRFLVIVASRHRARDEGCGPAPSNPSTCCMAW
jgi:hypothetical protein